MCHSCMNIGFGVRKWHTVKLISLCMILWDNNTIEGQKDPFGNLLKIQLLSKNSLLNVLSQFHDFECIINSEKCWSIVIIRTWDAELTSWVSSFYTTKDNKCYITLLLCDIYSQRIRASALTHTCSCLGWNSNKSETDQSVTILNVKWRLFYKGTFSENLQQIVRSPFLREF